uniref:Uncharacterized protein n=1 Tax=Oryza brachyantha TaxID=4533 RepID=J3L9W5_ORYBR
MLNDFANNFASYTDAGLLSRRREVHVFCTKLGLDSTPYVANKTGRVGSAASVAGAGRMPSNEISV